MKNRTWLIFLLFFTSLLYIGRHTLVNFYVQNTFEKSSIYDRGAWIKKDKLNPKVVFLGSSVTRHTIIPTVIKENSNLNDGDIVNLGMNAATPYEMYITFIKNKSALTKAKVFFFNLDPWIFSKKYYKYKEFEKSLWSNEEWNYYMPKNNNFIGYKTKLIKNSQRAKYTRAKFEDYGYARLKYNKTKKFKLSDKKEIHKFFNDKLNNNIAISRFQLKYLKKLKMEIKNNNSKFILLYIPNHISYTKAIFEYNKKYNLELARLLNNYLGDTKQYGSSNPKLLKLKKEDYFDRHHLGHNGALKYSNNLGNVMDLTDSLVDTKINIDYSY